MRLLLFSVLIATCFVQVAEARKPTVRGDKKYGKCYSSEVLRDFFERYPPRSEKFSLEIDLTKKRNEIFVYYHDADAYPGMTAYYDSKSCEFLRDEVKTES